MDTPDDDDRAGSVFQITLTRDWRRSLRVIDHLPVDERSGVAGLESTVAQRSELSAGSSNDKNEPLSGTVS